MSIDNKQSQDYKEVAANVRERYKHTFNKLEDLRQQLDKIENLFRSEEYESWKETEDYKKLYEKNHEVFSSSPNKEWERVIKAYQRKERSRIRKKAHKIFVDELLSPTKEGDAFARTLSIAELREDDTSATCELQIVTPSMLIIDLLFLYYHRDNATWIKENDSQINELIEILGISDREFALLEEVYKPYQFKFITYDIDNPCIKEMTRNVDDASRWFHVNLNRNDDRTIHGEFSFHASAEKIYAGVIIVNGKVVTEITKMLEKANTHLDSNSNFSYDTNVAEYLDNISDINNSSEAWIYNVGQANCVYIKTSSSNIFFDIGMPLTEYGDKKKGTVKKNPDMPQSSNYSTVQRNLRCLSYCKPDFIILSHWHADHIDAYKLLNTYAYKSCKWILPKPDNRIENDSEYCNLINYLIAENMVRFVANKSGLIYLHNMRHTSIKLFRGDVRSNNANDSSLVLCIGGSMFTGDCMCRAWTTAMVDEFMNHTVQAVIPHHGSAFTYADRNNLLSGSKKKIFVNRTNAIISAGANYYGENNAFPNNKHPTQQHIDELRNNKALSFSHVFYAGDENRTGVELKDPNLKVRKIIINLWDPSEKAEYW